MPSAETETASTVLAVAEDSPSSSRPSGVLGSAGVDVGAVGRVVRVGFGAILTMSSLQVREESLGDYFARLFRGPDAIPQSDVDYPLIASLWGSPDVVIHLSVGSDLQSSSREEYYSFISELYEEARRSLLGVGDFPTARALILTAGLFEQCRVSEVGTVLSFFAEPEFAGTGLAAEARGNARRRAIEHRMGLSMERVLPFCHRARVGSSSEGAARSYLEKIDPKQRKRELFLREPRVTVHFQNLGDDAPRKITLNFFTTVGNLVRSHGGSGTVHGTSEFSDDESVRIFHRREGKLEPTTFLPYASRRSLEILRVQDGDTLIVKKGGESCCVDGVDKSLLPNISPCFDPSLKHWLPQTFHDMIEGTKMLSEGDHPSLVKAIASFWSKPGTGRMNFLSADTQMVCTFSGENGPDRDPTGIAYLCLCYNNAKRYFEEWRCEESATCNNDAKSYVLTAGLIEQGQFTDVRKLLELYSECERVDEDWMKDHHLYLHRAYVATKNQDTLRRYIDQLDVEARKKEVKSKSMRVNLRFFNIQSKKYHKIEANPLIKLETLVGLHCQITHYSYRRIRITVHGGREIDFGTSRGRTLMELRIRNQDVLNLEDLGERVSESPRGASLDESLVKDFSERFANIVKHYLKKQMDQLKPEFRQTVGEERCMMGAIMNYFLQPEKMRMLSADEMERFEGNAPYDGLYLMARKFLGEGDLFSARGMFLGAALVEQCKVNGVREVLLHCSARNFSSPPSASDRKSKKLSVLEHHYTIAKDPHDLAKYLRRLDIDRHCDKLRDMEPRINVVFSNRENGVDRAFMTNVSSHMSFNHFVRKHAANKDIRSLHSLRIAYNGQRVFLSTCGKQTLGKLGMKDDDVLVVEDIGRGSNPLTKERTKCRIRGGNTALKKKKKGRASQKNKPRGQQITMPRTEEEFRREHSRRMSPVLEQLERQRLRHIRRQLNNLSIKKTGAKQRRPRDKKVDDNPIFKPLADGLEGKAGRIVFPVMVGDPQHLYKSSKKSIKAQRSQVVRAFDLHGCTWSEAITRLNGQMPTWTDAAMKEESFKIPVDIVCGGGSQILSEAVACWIRDNRRVANRPKGTG